MFSFPALLLLWLAMLCFVVALSTFFAFKKVANALQKIFASREFVRLFAVMIMLLAMIFLMVYAKLDGTWYMIFAIIGRAEMLKGFVSLLYPQYAIWKVKSLYGKMNVAMIFSIVLLFFTAFLTWVALVKF